MRRHFVISLLMVVLGGGQAWAKCTVRKAEVPVTMHGLQATVPATINGKSVRLQLDSGAWFSSLDEEVAKAAGLELSALDFDTEGVGGRVRTEMTTVRQFALAGIDGGRNRPFIVIPFSHGGLAVGLLGEDVLGSFDVEYDLANGLIRLMQIQDCGDNLAYWSDGSGLSVLPIEPRSTDHPHIIGTVLVNGKRMRAVFDTGASNSTISLKAAARAGVHPTDGGVTASDVVGGIGPRTLESWTGSFAEVQIGDEKIQNTQLEIDAKTPDAWDMLIGADFFLSHRVLVARSRSKMYFTYSGGPVFRLEEPPPKVVATTQAGAEPTAAFSNDPHDAVGFNRRGIAKLARHDSQGALADFGKAIELAPNDAKNFFDRGRAHWQLNQPDAAIADLSKAIELRPGYAEALLWRGDVYADTGHAAQSAADAAAAAAAGEGEWGTQIGIAELYGKIKQYDKGVVILDRLMASKPDERTVTNALERRCALRTRSGHDLDQALADCEAVLKRRGRNSETLAERALVRLRRGEGALALADFDAALKLQPKLAPALYGRGLARRRLGQAADADADVAAAKAIDPDIAKDVAWD